MKIMGGLMGEASGSLAGITASHNRGGQYLRQRTVPVNPNTARQQAVRGAFGGLIQAWSDTLTETQRQGWRDFAANVPVTDTLGNSITLTGQQMYVRNNTLRVQLANAGLTITGSDRIDDAPTIFNGGESVLSVTQFDINTATPLLTIAGLLTAGASDDGDVVVFLGLPVNPGVRFFKGPYQLAAAAAVSATDESYSITADPADPLEWAAAFQPGAAQDLAFMGLRLVVLYDDGRVSQEFRQLTEFSDVTP